MIEVSRLASLGSSPRQIEFKCWSRPAGSVASGVSASAFIGSGVPPQDFSKRRVSRVAAYRSVPLRQVASAYRASPKSALKGAFDALKRAAVASKLQRIARRLAPLRAEPTEAQVMSVASIPPAVRPVRTVH